MRFVIIMLLTALGMACGEKKSSSQDEAASDKNWWEVETAGEEDDDPEDFEDEKSQDKKDLGDKGEKAPQNRWSGSIKLADGAGSLRYFVEGSSPCDISYVITVQDSSVTPCDGCSMVKDITYGESKVTTDGPSCGTAGEVLKTMKAFGWPEVMGKSKDSPKIRRFVNDAWQVEAEGYVVSYEGVLYIGWGESIPGTAKDKAAKFNE